MFDDKAGADFVQVDQSLRSYSTGVAMGLTLAVVPDGKKKSDLRKDCRNDGTAS